MKMVYLVRSLLLWHKDKSIGHVFRQYLAMSKRTISGFMVNSHGSRLRVVFIDLTYIILSSIPSGNPWGLPGGIEDRESWLA